MGERDPVAVRDMFDRIAGRYDLLNTVLSGALDSRWRARTAAATAIPAGGRALDVACGSGKLTAALAGRAGPAGQVIGLDFSPAMLEIASKAFRRLHFVRGDALALPFVDAYFDAATIAFGLRNLSDPARGLAEMLRVVKPGGRAVVLEFVRPPRGPVGAAYRLYLRRVLPAVGGRISGDRTAYRYLSQTVDSYRTPGQLREMAAAAGWAEVAVETLAMGTVGLMAGVRPG